MAQNQHKPLISIKIKTGMAFDKLNETN